MDENQKKKLITIILSLIAVVVVGVFLYNKNVVNKQETAAGTTETTATEETSGETFETVMTLTEVTAESTSEAGTSGPEETAETTTAIEKTTEDSAPETTAESSTGNPAQSGISVEEDGEYSDKEHVALYIHTYGCLPGNYVTKQEAEDAGWVSSEGNLWEVLPGKSIGGSYFGNYEGLLPKEKGRSYYECDIDFDGGYRNAKRIIYSDDGLIFYTDDHYESFTQLY